VPTNLAANTRAAANWSKLLVTVLAFTALGFIVIRGGEVQAGVVALVVIAVLPWLASTVELINFPGGSVQLREQVQRQEEKLNSQQEVITQLVVYSMSWYIFDLLSKLYHRNRSGEEYLFRNNDAMPRDLRFLRDHGYVEHINIADLRDGENLVGRIRLTPVGNFLVEVREQLQAQQSADVARHLGSPTGQSAVW